MAETPIQVGDRVVSLSAPGIFTVVARRGTLITIESDRGVRLVVVEANLRRMP
ncbi:MAG TPA: hypothetical protein VKW76_15440 [Candidatus Binatia bacterium]|nr:hypothetical protein [Candidatus Binatia bacterium]